MVSLEGLGALLDNGNLDHGGLQEIADECTSKTRVTQDMAAPSRKSSRGPGSHPPASGMNPRPTATSMVSRDAGLSYRTFSMTDSHLVGLEEGVEGGVLRLEDDTRIRAEERASTPRGVAALGVYAWTGAWGLITRRQVGILRRNSARIEWWPNWGRKGCAGMQPSSHRHLHGGGTRLELGGRVFVDCSQPAQAAGEPSAHVQGL